MRIIFWSTAAANIRLKYVVLNYLLYRLQSQSKPFFVCSEPDLCYVDFSSQLLILIFSVVLKIKDVLGPNYTTQNRLRRSKK